MNILWIANSDILLYNRSSFYSPTYSQQVPFPILYLSLLPQRGADLTQRRAEREQGGHAVQARRAHIQRAPAAIADRHCTCFILHKLNLRLFIILAGVFIDCVIIEMKFLKSPHATGVKRKRRFWKVEARKTQILYSKVLNTLIQHWFQKYRLHLQMDPEENNLQ